MKQLMPFLVLLSVGLGCVAPRDRTETKKNSEPSPTIEYSTPKWENNGVALNLNFEVKNTSSRPLEFVKITASFYGKDQDFIKGEEIYISKWQHLSPGERSPALVMTDPKRGIKSVRLEFSCHGAKPFETVQINATEVSKIQ